MDNYIIRVINTKSNNKNNYFYYDKRNNKINDKKYIDECLKGLYIPPAYNNVKINLSKNGKVLAIGYDTKNRPQYIYNKKFKQEQSDKKFNHMYDFGLKFNKINKIINKDLYSFSDSKEKQIAIILKLIMDCNFRIGNEKYKKENNSFGVTTLQKKHVKIKNDKLIIDFNGKKNVRNTCKVTNKKVIKSLKNKRKNINNNDNLFTYRNGKNYIKIKSSDVNDYLKKFGNFSAKNFRTWGANIDFIDFLFKNTKKNFPENQKDIKNIVNISIKEVANKLHNTPAVCKSNYLDPEIINLFNENPHKFISTFDNDNKNQIINKYISFLEKLI